MAASKVTMDITAHSVPKRCADLSAESTIIAQKEVHRQRDSYEYINMYNPPRDSYEKDGPIYKNFPPTIKYINEQTPELCVQSAQKVMEESDCPPQYCLWFVGDDTDFTTAKQWSVHHAEERINAIKKISSWYKSIKQRVSYLERDNTSTNACDVCDWCGVSLDSVGRAWDIRDGKYINLSICHDCEQGECCMGCGISCGGGVCQYCRRDENWP